jgi:aminoglycoside phosphotransferase (APT) family kinase protein
LCYARAEEADQMSEAVTQRVEPSEAELRAIVSKHLTAGMRDARIVHHHCNTHAYITMEDGAQVVVRICDGPWWTEKPDKVDKFTAERYAWDRLGQIDSVETPRVIAIGTDETIVPYPYLIMTHVAGTPMCDVFTTLDPDEQIRLVEQLGAVAGRIHALPVDPESVPSEAMRWEGHSDDLRKQLDESVARGLITTRVRDRVEGLLSAHSSRLAAMDDDVVFLHGDLHFGNVLLQQNVGQWRLSGLVDAELAGIGPRGRELRALEPFSFRSCTTPRIREAFLRGYGEGFALDDYKLAYLTAELDPDYLNVELVKTIESADFSEDLGWIRIFKS